MVEWHQGVPDGITREDVELAIRDFEADAQHDFGPSACYDLVHEGRRLPPKAILGLAARRVAGRTLGSGEFSGGQASRCFKVLRDLGFEIVAKEAVPSPEPGPPALPGDAVSAFREMAGSPEMQRGVAEVLAEAVAEAHEVSPMSWAVTFNSRDPYLRLDVGRLFAVTLRHGRLDVLLDRGLLEQGATAAEGLEQPAAEGMFRSYPEGTWRAGPVDGVLAAWEHLREAHLAAVREAARQYGRSPYRKHHRPEVVEGLEVALGRALPRPLWPSAPEEDLEETLVSLVAERYPEWAGFDDPRFVKDEVSYKRAACELAAGLLGRETMAQLVEHDDTDELFQRLRRVASATNLLFLGVPRAGDLSILHADGLDRLAFCQALFHLLHGEGDAVDRLEVYLRFVESRGLPSRWPFPTYLLFLLHPESEVFVKPETTRGFLRLVGERHGLDSRPSAAGYRAVRDAAHRLRELLADYGPHDMVDIQSLMWVCAQQSKAREARLVKPDSLRELNRLFAKFLADYPESEAGKVHAGRYRSGREALRAAFAEVRGQREAGEDVTGAVLLKLLPHADTEGNPERGSWVHVAPVITKDLKQWFEGAGWVEADRWPEVATAVLDLLTLCADDPSVLEDACAAFLERAPAKGFQAAILSPALNALRPDDFVIFNRKSLLPVNYFTGSRLTTSLEEYPAANRVELALVEELGPALAGATQLEELHLVDRFDMFCHWLVAVERFPLNARYWKVAPGEGGWNWKACRDGGFIAIGWDDLGDLSGLTRAQFDEKAAALIAAKPDWTRAGVAQVWKLARSIGEGDRVVANAGTGQVLGIGTVAGPYYFRAGEKHGHRLPVEWDDLGRREVDRPGWKRTLIELSREDFEQVLAAPVVEDERSPAPESAEGDLFSARTFELLSALHQDPRREVYSSRKAEFRQYLEEPFRRLLEEVAKRMAPPLREALETERGVVARILKNDWGRGGAWPFYWGAFFPKGGRRVVDAQLFLWLDQGSLGMGFYIGEYGSDQRRRFVRQCKANAPGLARLLGEILPSPEFRFGARDETPEEPATAGAVTLAEWLEAPDQHGIRVGASMSAGEAAAASCEDLAALVASAFDRLFPLILVATANDPMAAVREYLEPEPPEEVEYSVQDAYPLAECAADLGMSEELLGRWVRAVERKGQAVLYGPPGTGKTYVAEHLARHLVGGANGFVEVVQFHPSYAYEDFIQGLRPVSRADNTLEYRLVPGRFVDFCRRARQRTGRCVLVVDEINRANLSRVFGELMYLLEYRDREVPLAGGETLRVPENVRLIGTMNTADRSIALVDHALRRRFAFLALFPDFEALRRYHRENTTGFDPEGLIGVLERANAAINDRHYEVGISFFLRAGLADEIEDVWRMEIEPYLEEHFFDRPQAVADFRWEKVRGKVLG